MPGRLRTALRILILLLIGAGILFLSTGLFAEALHLDNDPGWGKGRIALVVLGALMLTGAALLGLRRQIGRLWQAIANNRSSTSVPAFFEHVYSSAQNNFLYRAAANLQNKWSNWQPGFSLTATAQRMRINRTLLSALLATGITLLIYVWYLTSGTWNTWTPYSRYFDRQADAFLHGQLALLEEPSPELKTLANPYDWRARGNFGHLWDVSYYQERFYLYWGPAPALAATLAKLIKPGVVEDQALLFVFCGGVALFLSLQLTLIRDRLYRTAPAWPVFWFSLLGGLSLPTVWLVNRPNVYETAIASGQFFLMGGITFALWACLRDEKPSTGWLAAAGLAWGAAVASRMNLALVVIFFSALLAWHLLRQLGWRAALGRLAGLGLPLAAWAGALAWYNLARFGSILETGHRYQLTGPALPPDYHWVTSASYIIPSLYSYLLRPLTFNTAEFPYVFAPFLTEQMWPFFIHLPKYYYYPEPVASIFAVMPAVWLGLLPMLGLFRLGWRWLNEQPVSLRPRFSSPGSALVWGMAAGGPACLLAPLLIFITTSMRYLGDLAPMAVLFSVLGLWWGLRQTRPNQRRALSAVALLLVLLSLTISVLVNFGSGEKRFEANNPALYQSIAAFFHGKP